MPGRRISGGPLRPAMGRAALPTGAPLDQHGPAHRPARAARQVRAARFLDLLLHQLHAHPAGAAEAGEGVAQRAGRDRRPFGQVRERKGHQEHRGGRAPLPDRASRWSTTREFAIWNSYGVQAWPSLVLIDPEGYAVWGHSGEIDFRAARRAASQGGAVLSRKGIARQPAADQLRRRSRPRPRKRRCGFRARFWPTRPADGCSSPTATTTASSSRGSTARCWR